MDGAEVSRRLKAARWIAGGVDEKGRVAPLSNDALAQRDELVRNGITANRLSEFERMVSTPRPMELRVIAEALELPAGFFTGQVVQLYNEESELEHIESTLRDLVQVFSQTESDADLRARVSRLAAFLAPAAPDDESPREDLRAAGDQGNER